MRSRRSPTATSSAWWPSTRTPTCYLMAPLGNIGDVEGQIAGIKASGQTNIFAGLSAAVDSLEQSNAERRHIVLLTDGWSSSGEYTALLERMKAANITLSAVGAGGGGANAFLEGLADQGGGRYWPATNPASIPDIFLKETQQASGQQIIEEPFFPVQTGDSPILRGTEAGMPQLLGYNGSTLKPAAQGVLATGRDDCFLAQWQYGLGGRWPGRPTRQAGGRPTGWAGPASTASSRSWCRGRSPARSPAAWKRSWWPTVTRRACGCDPRMPMERPATSTTRPCASPRRAWSPTRCASTRSHRAPTRPRWASSIGRLRDAHRPDAVWQEPPGADRGAGRAHARRVPAAGHQRPTPGRAARRDRRPGAQRGDRGGRRVDARRDRHHHRPRPVAVVAAAGAHPVADRRGRAADVAGSPRPGPRTRLDRRPVGTLAHTVGAHGIRGRDAPGTRSSGRGAHARLAAGGGGDQAAAASAETTVDTGTPTAPTSTAPATPASPASRPTTPSPTPAAPRPVAATPKLVQAPRPAAPPPPPPAAAPPAPPAPPAADATGDGIARLRDASGAPGAEHQARRRRPPRPVVTRARGRPGWSRAIRN